LQDYEQDPAVKKERNSLLLSRQQYNDQQQELKRLMAQNEEALSKLDEAIVQVQDIKRTANNESPLDMEASMEQLHRMAQQSFKFSR
jgi:ssDNA-specific exonuclease RecJ